MGEWAEWWSENEDKIRKYLSARKASASYETLLQEGFVDLLTEGDANTLDGEFGKANRWTTTLVMPLYFWIVDDRKAVFALAPFMEDALEVGFRTSDGELIRALRGIFDRYREMDETEKV
jgi:hypothetical protein